MMYALLHGYLDGEDEVTVAYGPFNDETKALAYGKEQGFENEEGYLYMEAIKFEVIKC